jgi:ABC-type proline/glycine betaine transport system substrate-binding protein
LQTKEARFTVKKDSTCDLEAIKKVMKDVGFTVSLLAAEDNVYEAIVVKTGDDRITLTMKDDDQKHTHDVGKDAKITLDDKTVKLEDLKEGLFVKVTMDDKSIVTKIDAKPNKK